MSDELMGNAGGDTSAETPALRPRITSLGGATSGVEFATDYRDNNTDGTPWLRVTVEWDGEPFEGRDGSWVAEAFESDGKGGWKESPEDHYGTIGYGATKEDALGMLVGAMLANVYLYKQWHREAEERLRVSPDAPAPELGGRPSVGPSCEHGFPFGGTGCEVCDGGRPSVPRQERENG